MLTQAHPAPSNFVESDGILHYAVFNIRIPLQALHFWHVTQDYNVLFSNFGLSCTGCLSAGHCLIGFAGCICVNRICKFALAGTLGIAAGHLTTISRLQHYPKDRTGHVD